MKHDMCTLLRSCLSAVLLFAAQGFVVSKELYAQTPIAPPAIYPQDTWEGRNIVVLHVLDRLKSELQTVKIMTNQTFSIGTTRITLRRCLRRAPTLPQDDAAWLEIRDEKLRDSSFDGWMIRSMPQLGVFEHPVYDVRLMGCVGDPTDPLLPKLEKPKAPDAIPQAASSNGGGLDNLRVQPDKSANTTIMEQPLARPDLPDISQDEEMPAPAGDQQNQKAVPSAPALQAATPSASSDPHQGSKDAHRAKK